MSTAVAISARQVETVFGDGHDLGHGHRLRLMRGLTRLRSTQTISSGHALVQNIRRGHYELGTDTDPRPRLAAAFDELALAI